MPPAKIICKETGGLNMRVRRERDEAWKRLEEEYPRVKSEHPDKWVAFGKDGFIAASDDLFALIAAYEKKGYAGDQVLIRFMHVSTISLWGELA